MKVNSNKPGSMVKTDTASGVKSSALNSSKITKDAADLFTTDVGSSAKLDFSEKVQDVKRANQIARQGLNDVDEAKVAKFQALIDGGKYKVDAAKVADKMVDEHLANEFAAREASD